MPFPKRKEYTNSTKQDEHQNETHDKQNFSEAVATKSKKRKKSELETLYDDLQTVYREKNKQSLTYDVSDVGRTRRKITKQSAQPVKSKSLEKKLMPRGRQV